MRLSNYPLPVGEKNIFADDNEDDWQDEEWKKKKKSVGGKRFEENEFYSNGKDTVLLYKLQMCLGFSSKKESTLGKTSKNLL